jgi:fructose-specific phosphotransferase system component IIB
LQPDLRNGQYSAVAATSCLLDIALPHTFWKAKNIENKGKYTYVDVKVV